MPRPIFDVTLATRVITSVEIEADDDKAAAEGALLEGKVQYDDLEWDLPPPGHRTLTVVEVNRVMEVADDAPVPPGFELVDETIEETDEDNEPGDENADGEYETDSDEIDGSDMALDLCALIDHVVEKHEKGEQITAEEWSGLRDMSTAIKSALVTDDEVAPENIEGTTQGQPVPDPDPTA